MVTNDWFTGLVPGNKIFFFDFNMIFLKAYAKKSGAFGTVFYGTTFFHLVHNLEEVKNERKLYV